MPTALITANTGHGDARFSRPAGVELLVADPRKAKQGFVPTLRVSLHRSIVMVVDSPVARRRAAAP